MLAILYVVLLIKLSITFEIINFIFLLFIFAFKIYHSLSAYFKRCFPNIRSQQQSQLYCMSHSQIISSNHIASSFGKLVKPKWVIGNFVIWFFKIGKHIFFKFIIIRKQKSVLRNFRQRFVGLPDITMLKIMILYYFNFLQDCW